MEALLQALYHEKASGHFFRAYLRKTKNKVKREREVAEEGRVEVGEGGGGIGGGGMVRKNEGGRPACGGLVAGPVITRRPRATSLRPG